MVRTEVFLNTGMVVAMQVGVVAQPFVSTALEMIRTMVVPIVFRDQKRGSGDGGTTSHEINSSPISDQPDRCLREV